MERMESSAAAVVRGETRSAEAVEAGTVAELVEAVSGEKGSTFTGVVYRLEASESNGVAEPFETVDDVLNSEQKCGQYRSAHQ